MTHFFLPQNLVYFLPRLLLLIMMALGSAAQAEYKPAFTTVQKLTHFHVYFNGSTSQTMESAIRIETELGVTSATANAIIRDFVKLQILQEITGMRRDRLYVFDRYLRQFAD